MIVRFSRDLASLNSSAVPTSDTNGVARPDGFDGARIHIVVAKANVCNLDVYGYCANMGQSNWARLESIALTGLVDEAVQLTGAGGYTRIATVVSGGITLIGVNTAVGFTQHDRGE